MEITPNGKESRSGVFPGNLTGESGMENVYPFGEHQLFPVIKTETTFSDESITTDSQKGSSENISHADEPLDDSQSLIAVTGDSSVEIVTDHVKTEIDESSEIVSVLPLAKDKFPVLRNLLAQSRHDCHVNQPVKEESVRAGCSFHRAPPTFHEAPPTITGIYSADDIRQKAVENTTTYGGNSAAVRQEIILRAANIKTEPYYEVNTELDRASAVPRRRGKVKGIGPPRVRRKILPKPPVACQGRDMNEASNIVTKKQFPGETLKITYPCTICDKVFSYASRLAFHITRHNTEKGHCCSVCKNTFPNTNALRRHRKEHAPKKQYACSLCYKSYSHPFELKRHMFKHTGEKPYQCELCEKSFAIASRLKVHQLTHTEERPFKCDICQQSFKFFCSLKLHKMKHLGMSDFRSFCCDICGKTFARGATLRLHKLTHSAEKPFSCNKCDKSFARRWQLECHNAAHTGTKPYSCTLCKKTFARRYSLKQHNFTHTGERPYKCNICQKAFRRSAALSKHRRKAAYCKVIASKVSPGELDSNA